MEGVLLYTYKVNKIMFLLLQALFLAIYYQSSIFASPWSAKGDYGMYVLLVARAMMQ